jgi:stage II sporulation protein D
VAIAHRLPSLTIDGGDTVRAADGRYASLITPGDSWTVTACQGRLEARTGAGAIITEIAPKLTFSSRTAFSWNGQTLACPLTVSPEGDSALLAVIELPLEEYLLGVLAREMGNAGEAELEALKAQAVAARGYAYVKIGSKPGAAYDLESDVSHQAFVPAAAGNAAVRKAVEGTRGQVMACRGRVFAPNYHSTCGGRTALPSEAWGTPDSLFPWARSVEDKYCRISPKYSWKQGVPPGEIMKCALGMSDTTIPVTGVTVLERGRSGRVSKVKITSEVGDIVLNKDSIRFSLSYRPLPSTWFEVKCIRDGLGKVASAEFTGKGYGHGVGMCQWGAMGMAREGKKYKMILKKYFSDVVIIILY